MSRIRVFNDEVRDCIETISYINLSLLGFVIWVYCLFETESHCVSLADLELAI